MTDQIHRILTRVQKPARYVGGEYNQIVKRKQDVDVRVAFCFPDTYEIGMSHLGIKGRIAPARSSNATAQPSGRV